MRYVIAAVGNLKRGFYADGCSFYADRLSHLAKLDLVEIKERSNDPQRRTSESSDALLAHTAGTHRVALDERGDLKTSDELAQRLTHLENLGVSKLGVMIGGADGHSAHLRAEADEIWSLTPLTLPHELARLVVLEQLYRAETIRAGHPYHRR